MAGGPNAAVAPCMHCDEAADRESEGQETDWYLCRSCGKRFGWDFDGRPQPATPLWPPTEEERRERAEIRRRMAGLAGG